MAVDRPSRTTRRERRGSGRSAKTLWDWLQLLGIPVALAALAFLLNDAQTRRDQRREDQRAAQLQERAADAERENTLRAYLAQMFELMLNDDLVQSKQGADASNVARTATLTALRRLDGPRRGLVVRFLIEARLLSSQKHFRSFGRRFRIFPGVDPRRPAPVVSLSGADLSRADLRQAFLFTADLRGADLSRADLRQAFLFTADLRGAELRGADLRGAILRQANLHEVLLGDADLSGANLRRTNLRGEDLRGADLRGADLRGAELFAANVRGANLRQANLHEVLLGDADLRGANLRGANLRGANLRGADLRGARHAELADTRGTPAHGP
jgi:hypothetical protein